MHTQLTLLFAVFAVAHCTIKVPDNARELYEQFKQKYGKQFNNKDDEKRFINFKQNLVRIQVYQMYEKGTAKYGVTKFADLSAEEFASTYLPSQMKIPLENERTKLEKIYKPIPENVDWRNKGAVTPVEDQGPCGSGWAFATAGNIESQWFMKTKQLWVVSKQHLIDCDTVDEGCDGGYHPKTFEEIVKIGGLQSQTDYPYIAKGTECHMDKSKIVVFINDSYILERDEQKQAAELTNKGPISTSMNAVQLQFYQGGILHPSHCNPKELNHAVLVVGYGNEHGRPFWLVKNSWDTNWGEEGYFRVYRGDGTCGINLLATMAVIK